MKLWAKYVQVKAIGQTIQIILSRFCLLLTSSKLFTLAFDCHGTIYLSYILCMLHLIHTMEERLKEKLQKDIHSQSREILNTCRVLW